MDRYRMQAMQNQMEQQQQMLQMRRAQAAARTPQPSLKTVLDENKLRFTLSVDSIRLKGK
jgi:hypothetical protein